MNLTRINNGKWATQMKSQIPFYGCFADELSFKYSQIIVLWSYRAGICHRKMFLFLQILRAVRKAVFTRSNLAFVLSGALLPLVLSEPPRRVDVLCSGFVWNRTANTNFETPIVFERYAISFFNKNVNLFFFRPVLNGLVRTFGLKLFCFKKFACVKCFLCGYKMLDRILALISVFMAFFGGKFLSYNKIKIQVALKM